MAYIKPGSTPALVVDLSPIPVRYFSSFGTCYREEQLFKSSRVDSIVFKFLLLMDFVIQVYLQIYTVTMNEAFLYQFVNGFSPLFV